MAQRRCKSPVSCPPWARAFLAGILSVCLLFAASTGAVAQFGRSTDGVRGPSVFVDMDVLRSLGPARTVPRVLLPTLRQPRMPGVRAPETYFPNRPAPGPAVGRIVLTPPSSLQPRKSKRRAAKKRAPRPTPPKMVTRKAQIPPAAPRIQSVRKIPAAPKPPRALIQPTPKPAVKKTVIKPVRKTVVQKAAPKIVKPAVPKAAPETRKPPMPRVLARPSPPPPRPTIAPPPLPRKIGRAAPAKPRQTASLPPGGKSGAAIAAGNMVRLGFDSGKAKLPGPAIKQLDAVIAKLTKQTSLRLQLLAYADGASTSGSQARRLSLSRALAVRSYLIEKGIRSTRIDVRALGNQVKGSPADRVDVIINKR